MTFRVVRAADAVGLSLLIDYFFSLLILTTGLGILWGLFLIAASSRVQMRTNGHLLDFYRQIYK